MEIQKNIYNEYILSIKLVESGTKALSIATGKTIGKKSAFIFDNQLIETLIV